MTRIFLMFLALPLLLGCASFSSATNGLPVSSDAMVRVPAGYFVMGSGAEDGKIGFEIGVDELPKHKVYLKEFYIDRYEVTEEDYFRFLAATGSRKYPGYWEEAGRADRYPEGHENHPVSDVDWFDADDYCRWAGKRLPTETEWEKAARGTEGALWPWGNIFVSGNANTEESSQHWEAPEGQESVYGWKAPVGFHPEDLSPFGVYDMAGNVREWTASKYRSYPGNEIRPVDGKNPFRILRGGSYMTPGIFSRAAARVAVLPSIGPGESDGWHSDYTYGFRCVKDE